MPSTCVGDLMDVNDARDCGVPVAKQECDFVHALARQEGPGGHRVPERMDRRHDASGHRDRFAIRVRLVEDRERLLAVLVSGSLLRVSERTSDVALPEWAA